MWFTNHNRGDGAMTEENIRMIYDMSAERIRETDTSFHRYLFDEIDWDVLQGVFGI
jgi:hypothetical protein